MSFSGNLRRSSVHFGQLKISFMLYTELACWIPLPFSSINLGRA